MPKACQTTVAPAQSVLPAQSAVVPYEDTGGGISEMLTAIMPLIMLMMVMMMMMPMFKGMAKGFEA